jgi:hypothetical protein
MIQSIFWVFEFVAALFGIGDLIGRDSWGPIDETSTNSQQIVESVDATEPLIQPRQEIPTSVASVPVQFRVELWLGKYCEPLTRKTSRSEMPPLRIPGISNKTVGLQCKGTDLDKCSKDVQPNQPFPESMKMNQEQLGWAMTGIVNSTILGLMNVHVELKEAGD